MLWLNFLALVACSPDAFAVSSINIQIGEVSSPQGQARNIKLDYQLNNKPEHDKPGLRLKGQFRTPDEKSWTDAYLSCRSVTYTQEDISSGQWRCDHGGLTTEHIKAPFSLSLNQQKVHGQQKISATLALTEASISDAAGLHAGEKLTGTLSINARQEGNQWQWLTMADWASGEVFWQPFYFASGGHRVQASGQYTQQILSIDTANLSLKDVGNISFNGQFRLGDKKFQTLSLTAPNLDLATLYPLILKPLLEKTALNNLEMAGQAGLKISLQNGELRSFQLDLDNADIDDKNGRFSLYKVNANIPWSYDDASNIKLSYQGGQLLRVPLGATTLAAELNRYALTATQLQLPILDGTLNLSDVSAGWAARQWHWHLRANISPIDLPELSQALGWPHMEGKVSASIPMVTYSGGHLTTDGAMGFYVFGGNIAVTDLAMQNPLGVAPRFYASLQFMNLDLGDLTRTFSFGAIEGKLDGDVAGMELVKWQPVKFDADFHSSPGRYPKKISQRAVENISALGGAGAGAAIQRSFLRFFKEFNYEKIGLSCKLRNDKCEMNGVESTPQGYIIVKGSGIPSITVMGYNHDVGWGELLARIKRITSGNAKPVVK